MPKLTGREKPKHPTDVLAVRVEQHQRRFSLQQNIASNFNDCTDCLLIDMCIRGDSGGNCRLEEIILNEQDKLQGILTNSFFGLIQ